MAPGFCRSKFQNRLNDMLNLRQLMKRERRPGDLVFAVLFFSFAVFLAGNLDTQTRWVSRTSLFAQPSFWPTVSIVGMVVFGALHWLGSIMSKRIPGRLQEIWFWIRSLEYACWFMIYVWLVPLVGYLFSTVFFAVFLVVRVGYRRRTFIWSALISASVIVLIFKAGLQVKIPGGALYEYLPTSLRSFMLTYL